MQVSAWLIGGAVIFGVGLVVISRGFSKRRLVKNRKPVELVEMYEESGLKGEVSFETFDEIINDIGSSFRIDPRLLRPSDLLVKLYELDSWDVGEGARQLSEEIEKKFGVSSLKNEPASISELIVEVERQQVLERKHPN